MIRLVRLFHRAWNTGYSETSHPGWWAGAILFSREGEAGDGFPGGRASFTGDFLAVVDGVAGVQWDVQRELQRVRPVLRFDY